MRDNVENASTALSCDNVSVYSINFRFSQQPPCFPKVTVAKSNVYVLSAMSLFCMSLSRSISQQAYVGSVLYQVWLIDCDCDLNCLLSSVCRALTCLLVVVSRTRQPISCNAHSPTSATPTLDARPAAVSSALSFSTTFTHVCVVDVVDNWCLCVFEMLQKSNVTLLCHDCKRHEPSVKATFLVFFFTKTKCDFQKF